MLPDSWAAEEAGPGPVPGLASVLSCLSNSVITVPLPQSLPPPQPPHQSQQCPSSINPYLPAAHQPPHSLASTRAQLGSFCPVLGAALPTASHLSLQGLSLP